MAKDSKPFVFKQFHLIQGSGAWKVSTDSILLGSWSAIDNVSYALDMGAGSGILSMMLAQRNENMRIDAIEIASEAIAEARINVQRSRWADRIKVIQRDIAVLDPENISKYDLIVCNPPYFPSGISSSANTRIRSRQGNGFSIWDVPRLASVYLKPSGRLNVVVPTQHAYAFISEANIRGLYVHKALTVCHNAKVRGTLMLLELSDGLVHAEYRTLILYSNNTPTAEYVSLCESYITI